MKNLTTLLLFGIFTLGSFSADAQISKKRKSKKDTHQFRYEASCLGAAVDGNYAIKIFSYSKKPKIAIEAAKKNAVHAIIFKGINNGECSYPALVKGANAEQEYADFFNSFFADGGGYMKYVSTSGDGRVKPSDVTMVSKKEYKIGVNVSVQKDILREALKSAGIKVSGDMSNMW